MAQAKGFEEDLVIIDTDAVGEGEWRDRPEILDIQEALVLGLRDYARRCGFNRAVLGLSGGIDSAVTAVLAAKALGAANVTGALMPSPYSSKGSVVDSLKLAEAIGITPSLFLKT